MTNEQHEEAKADAAAATTTTKGRIHGERVAALRAALRIPSDDYSDSPDAYNPKKPPKRFIKLHAEETKISAEFHVHTRAMFFEREVVDRDVCDRIENREWFDAQLREIYDHDNAHLDRRDQ
uniref:Uncharacterized protein n=1 Tax=Globisporangium ultimum (strain ATCC 200006 / CBS 805.95 / DAOM BR144) TaxID=431595 RepID=K3WUE7_GLOUD